MIGVGSWKCRVDTMFFEGEVKFDIIDNNGEYDIKLYVNDVMPEFTVKSLAEENGDTIHGIGTAAVMPGKELEVFLTFNGDKFTGYVKVPFLGKIKLKDGCRIQE